MRKYTTVQGDMWDNIAKKIYGEESYMNILLEANQQYQNYVIFPANVELLCPEIGIKHTMIIPPWKR